MYRKNDSPQRLVLIVVANIARGRESSGSWNSPEMVSSEAWKPWQQKSFWYSGSAPSNFVSQRNSVPYPGQWVSFLLTPEQAADPIFQFEGLANNWTRNMVESSSTTEHAITLVNEAAGNFMRASLLPTAQLPIENYNALYIDNQLYKLTASKIASLVSQKTTNTIRELLANFEVQKGDVTARWDASLGRGVAECTGTVNWPTMFKLEFEVETGFDSSTGATYIAPTVSEFATASSEDLTAALAKQQAQISQLNADIVKWQQGEELSVYDSAIPIEYTSLQTAALKDDFLGWHTAWLEAMQKLRVAENSQSDRDKALAAYRLKIGDPNATWEQYIEALTSQSATAKPGLGNSFYDTLKDGAASLWSTITKWGPTEMVGAYAGYKATNALTGATKGVPGWLLLVGAGVLTYALLK